jgi:hypothetical protein
MGEGEKTAIEFFAAESSPWPTSFVTMLAYALYYRWKHERKAFRPLMKLSGMKIDHPYAPTVALWQVKKGIGFQVHTRLYGYKPVLLACARLKTSPILNKQVTLKPNLVDKDIID